MKLFQQQKTLFDNLSDMNDMVVVKVRQNGVSTAIALHLLEYIKINRKVVYHSYKYDNFLAFKDELKRMAATLSDDIDKFLSFDCGMSLDDVYCVVFEDVSEYDDRIDLIRNILSNYKQTQVVITTCATNTNLWDIVKHSKYPIKFQLYDTLENIPHRKFIEMKDSMSPSEFEESYVIK